MLRDCGGARGRCRAHVKQLELHHGGLRDWIQIWKGSSPTNPQYQGLRHPRLTYHVVGNASLISTAFLETSIVSASAGVSVRLATFSRQDCISRASTR